MQRTQRFDKKNGGMYRFEYAASVRTRERTPEKEDKLQSEAIEKIQSYSGLHSTSKLTLKKNLSKVLLHKKNFF